MFWRKGKKDVSPPGSPKSLLSYSMENKSLPNAPKSPKKKSKLKLKKHNFSLLSENRKEKKRRQRISPDIKRTKNKKRSKSPESSLKEKVKKEELAKSPGSSISPKNSKNDNELVGTAPSQTQHEPIIIESKNKEPKPALVKKTTIQNSKKKPKKEKKRKNNLSSATLVSKYQQTESSGSDSDSKKTDDDQPLLPNKMEIPKKEKIEKKAKLKDKPKKPKQTKQYKKIEIESDEDNLAKPANIIHLPKLSESEVEFLELVTNDDIKGVKSHLSSHPGLNVNCANFQGVSALHLAVQNGNEEMVEFLLAQPNIDISDTVLHAVKENKSKILVMLLDAQKNISPGLEFAGASHSTDFPDHVTPLILAAQEGNYEIVELLVSRGHTIARPHQPNCLCADCTASLAKDDQLDTCTTRLSIYQAIASPAYLVHVSSDPILSAFRLTAELTDNANAYRQLSAAYLELKNRVSAFAVDLIGCCRTSQEVEVLLKQNAGTRGRRYFVLPRLLMAVDYKQKEFVAHPNTQQVLESYWMGNWYSWRSKKPIKKALIVLTRVFITPLILVMSLVLPNSRLLKHWKIPLNKLITHAAAYVLFLIIIFYISNQDRSEERRGPPNTGAEPLLILYVLGYIWSSARMCVMQGPRRYFSELWNWGEIIMLILFGVTFIFWMAAVIDCQINEKEELERKYWNQYDPILLAEGTFCLATICAYFRLMYLCQLNYHLGPLQVSLGKMTVDIFKYITIFAILLLSFGAGLSRFYQYYDGMVYEDEFGMKTVQVSSFTSISDTLNTLFWAIFCMAPLESADVIIENSKDPNNPKEELENHHKFTEKIGYFCFACFEVMSVIVVLNMLIATMSNTFQRVIDNVAIEWTFGKTEVYVDYMSQTTLPSPYNLIPTASGMKSILEWFRVVIRNPPGLYARWSPSYCCYIERDVEANIQKEYPTLMSLLIQRYFREKKASTGGVENEIESLKREFISLKNTIENKIEKN